MLQYSKRNIFNSEACNQYCLKMYVMTIGISNSDVFCKKWTTLFFLSVWIMFCQQYIRQSIIKD